MTEFSVEKLSDQYAVIADDQAVMSFASRKEALAMIEAVESDDPPASADGPKA